MGSLINEIIKDKLDNNEILFFKGNDNESYVHYVLNDCIYTDNIHSERAKAFLRELCRKETEDDLMEINIDDLQPFFDKVMLYDEPETVYYRICQDGNNIEYALHNKKNTIICIDDSGTLRVTDDSEHFFVKRGYMEAQPLPKKTKESLYSLLLPFINLSEEDFIIFLCLLVVMILPEISHYAILVSSEYGCGKTTLCNIISELIDNSVGGVTVMPSRVEDIKVNMATHYIVSFDNVVEKNIKDVSDLIAASVTGANYTKRKLYSDLEEVNVRLHNICLLNGINILNQNKDLLSRSLVLQPLKITETNRKTDTEFWAQFYKVKPQIMYRLFKAVSRVLSLKGTVEVTSRERMADAYEYMVLAGIALGFEQQYVEDLISNNRQVINNLAYQNENGIVSLVADYVDGLKGNSITGSVTAVYKDICRRFNPEDYGIDKFPANASSFSRKLTELETELIAVGVSFIKSTKKNYTEITLCNKRSKSKRSIKLKNDKAISRPVKHNTASDYTYDEQFLDERPLTPEEIEELEYSAEHYNDYDTGAEPEEDILYDYEDECNDDDDEFEFDDE